MDNPLQTNPAREERVREHAYHLWEADGKPHGRDVEYWQRARELVAMEESAGVRSAAQPADPSRIDAARPVWRRRKSRTTSASSRTGSPTRATCSRRPQPRRSPARQRKAPGLAGEKAQEAVTRFPPRLRGFAAVAATHVSEAASRQRGSASAPGRSHALPSHLRPGPAVSGPRPPYRRAARRHQPGRSPGCSSSTRSCSAGS